MRFKTSVKNVQTFTKFTASLASIGKLAWVRLDNDIVRFTIIPENHGSQVWASLAIESIFEDYSIQSQTENNTINLELPLAPLQRALRSAVNASSASLRLTKKDGVPVMSLTISTTTPSLGKHVNSFWNGGTVSSHLSGDEVIREESLDARARDREAIVTQDIPVRVLTASSVENVHEPRVREPDVHILLPSLVQLKAVSDRFTKLAAATGGGTATFALSSTANVPKLEMSANMHGSLKLSISTDALNICSVWTGLNNPELDPSQVQDGIESHPSSILRDAGPDAWATVRIDGRDWGRVLSVGRMGGRVIACFVNEHALILYVYLSNYDHGGDESVLTYYINSYIL